MLAIKLLACGNAHAINFVLRVSSLPVIAELRIVSSAIAVYPVRKQM